MTLYCKNIIAVKSSESGYIDLRNKSGRIFWGSLSLKRRCFANDDGYDENVTIFFIFVPYIN
jgi:hypothetical protein